MSPMPYQYVVLRCVPRVEREEFVNIGVVVYCQDAEFLDAAWHVDEPRVHALGPKVSIDDLCDRLRYVDAVCRGDDGLGSISAQNLGTRFGFVKAPRSTMIQPSPVHGGITAEPAAELTRLLDLLVR
jgi:hypothetical protein